MKDLKEKIIAVVGVSNRPEKFGYKIFKSLIEGGFNVSGVNPAAISDEVLGRKIYRTLSDIETKPDMVITVVPASVTEQVVEQCKELGIPEIWMQPGSESETAIKKAKEYGIHVTHHACMMIDHGIW